MLIPYDTHLIDHDDPHCYFPADLHHPSRSKTLSLYLTQHNLLFSSHSTSDPMSWFRNCSMDLPHKYLRNVKRSNHASWVFGCIKRSSVATRKQTLDTMKHSQRLWLQEKTRTIFIHRHTIAFWGWPILSVPGSRTLQWIGNYFSSLGDNQTRNGDPPMMNSVVNVFSLHFKRGVLAIINLSTIFNTVRAFDQNFYLS